MNRSERILRDSLHVGVLGRAERKGPGGRAWMKLHIGPETLIYKQLNYPTES